MPVHENRFGIDRIGGYTRADVHNEYSDSVLELHIAAELRDIA
jgi:hypothetical protein